MLSLRQRSTTVCNSLLYVVPKYLLLRLQRVLNCAARIVFKSNKYNHITPLLKELHWLPIEQRIKFKILLITFKALNKQAQNYITDLLRPYKPSRSLRSSAKNLLVQSQVIWWSVFCVGFSSTLELSSTVNKRFAISGNF